MAISIKVNGEQTETSEGQTVLALLSELGVDPERVAIELNRRILKQPLWGDTTLHAGAELEIVQFVGGG